MTRSTRVRALEPKPTPKPKSKPGKPVGAARPRLTVLEEHPDLVTAIVEAASSTAPRVTLNALAEFYAECEGETPAAVTKRLVEGLRVWRVFQLEYWTSDFPEVAVARLLSDATNDRSWLVHFVEGEPGLYPVGAAVPAKNTDWDAATQQRIAKCVQDAFATEGFGYPSDVLVPDALEWLIAPLDKAAKRFSERSRPRIWLTSKAPPQRERMNARR